MGGPLTLPAEGTNTRRVLEALPSDRAWVTSGELADSFDDRGLNYSGEVSSYLLNLEDRGWVEKRKQTGRMTEYRLSDAGAERLGDGDE